MLTTSMGAPTIADIRSRIQCAQTPSLLMLVAHLTDDPSVLRDEWRPNTDALPASGLPEETDDEIREFCLARLEPLVPGMDTWPIEPSEHVLHAIRDWVLGTGEDEEVSVLLRAAFVPPGTDPRGPRWTKDDIAPDRTMRVAVIGAGLSGLLAGLRMKQAGLDVTIFEKDDSVGGTWYENSYPDCRIDVHSHIYTYSFYPHDWPSYFSRQGVILDYLRSFAEDYGLMEHIQFNTEVRSAQWSDDEQVWQLVTIDRDGNQSTADYNVLVSAVGQLNRPLIPAIEGLETFGGPVFHSAQWDHSIDYAGKRVAVIGTGASAIQIVPALAREVESLTVFQRSAPWLQPTPELRRDIPEQERWLLTQIPLYRAYYRFSIFLPRAIGKLGSATVDDSYPPTEYAVSARNAQMRDVLTAYIEGQVGDDPELAAQVIPDYPPGAKRIVRDDGTWIKTLKADNVRLISGAAARVDETGVWTPEGEHIEADVICFGTGFAASDFLMPMKVTGANGKDLHETWGIDACAYMGLTVPGFPNMFCLYGPNTNLVLHGNLVFFMECQSVYLLSAIETLLREGKSAMSLQQGVFDEYREEVTEASARRVWGWSKTHSWYQNAEGRSTIMWPLPAQRYVEGTAAVVPDHYEFA